MQNVVRGKLVEEGFAETGAYTASYFKAARRVKSKRSKYLLSKSGVILCLLLVETHVFKDQDLHEKPCEASLTATSGSETNATSESRAAYLSVVQGLGLFLDLLTDAVICFQHLQAHTKHSAQARCRSTDKTKLILRPTLVPSNSDRRGTTGVNRNLSSGPSFGRPYATIAKLTANMLIRASRCRQDTYQVRGK